MIRETRTHLGLSRETLEQRAKVGTDYVKKLELGRRQRAEAGRLRRVVQAVQQAAARGEVPAKLTARIARVVKEVAKPEEDCTVAPLSSVRRRICSRQLSAPGAAPPPS